jgi:uncharacterized protein
MELWIAVFVVAVVLVAATVQTVAGFGFALVTVPLFVAVLDVQDAVVLTTLVGIINNTLLAQRSWRHIPWPTVGPMLAGAFAGMPMGLMVLLYAPPDALRIAVGVSTIVMAAALALGLRIPDRTITGEVAVGLASGVLNTSIGMNGPPVVVYLQGREHTPGEMRGALAIFFFVCNVATLGIFAASLTITRTSLALWPLTLPAVGVGSLVGARLAANIGAARFRRLVFALLAASAVSAIASSFVRLVN